MQITKEILVRLDCREPDKDIHMKQYDKSSRRLHISLTDGTVPVTIPSAVKARVACKKPDGKQVINDCVVSGNAVLVEITEQMLMAAGNLRCELCLYEGETLLNSATFTIHIEPSVLVLKDVLSSDEYNALTAAFERVEVAVKEAEQATKDAKQAILDAQEAKAISDAATSRANAAAANAEEKAALADAATTKANEAAQAANLAADRVQEAQQACENATAACLTATQLCQEATEAANLAASNADTQTQAAKNATDSANQAAQAANTAAENAQAKAALADAAAALAQTNAELAAAKASLAETAAGNADSSAKAADTAAERAIAAAKACEGIVAGDVTEAVKVALEGIKDQPNGIPGLDENGKLKDYVSKSGDTMTGELNMGGNNLALNDNVSLKAGAIGQIPFMVTNAQGLSLGEINGSKSTMMFTDGLSLQMLGYNSSPMTITNIADPQNPTDVATKQYVDNNAGGGGVRTCRFVVGTSTAGWTEKDCDYLCDGTDDQVEIQAALDALPVAGGEVLILDGEYKITAGISINKPYTTLSGTGFNTRLTRMYDETVENNGLITTGRKTTGFLLKDICIFGNKFNYTNRNNHGLVIGSIQYVMILNSAIFYNGGNGIHETGSIESMGGGCSYINNYLEQNLNGIFASPSTLRKIIGNTCAGNDENGIYANAPIDGVFNNNQISYNSQTGITIKGVNNGTRIILNGNEFRHNEKMGIQADKAHHITISNNWIDNSGLGVRISNSNLCSVSGNNMSNVKNNNFVFDTINGLTVSGNTLNGDPSISDTNHCGISLQSVKNTNITGNFATNFVKGIFANGSENINISANTVFRGNGLTSDYPNSNYNTVEISSSCKNGLVANNLTLGKNLLNQGTDITLTSNKY